MLKLLCDASSAKLLLRKEPRNGSSIGDQTMNAIRIAGVGAIILVSASGYAFAGQSNRQPAALTEGTKASNHHVNRSCNTKLALKIAKRMGVKGAYVSQVSELGIEVTGMSEGIKGTIRFLDAPGCPRDVR